MCVWMVSRLGSSEETSVFCSLVFVLPKEEVLLRCVDRRRFLAIYSLHVYQSGYLSVTA